MSDEGLAGLGLAGALVCCGLVQGGAAEAASERLSVYFIDVEGGQATLFVTPAGKSLLIDTGWDGNGGRDAGRIVAAAKKAGLSRIDDVLITHFHQDHVGGVPALLERMPVGTFIDHGENRELTDRVNGDYANYLAALKQSGAKRIVAHAGDVLPVEGMQVRVLSGDGAVLGSQVGVSGEVNPTCAGTEKKGVDATENARSLGVEITFGKLKILDLGDLTWDKELEMVCPVNRIGKVDVYVVSHHGWYQSSSPAMVDAIHARVAIMDNGETKGGSVATMETLGKAPGLETLWQVHTSAEGGSEHNADGQYVANLLGADGGKGLEMMGSADGSFDVVNERTGFSKHYGVVRVTRMTDCRDRRAGRGSPAGINSTGPQGQGRKRIPAGE